MATEVSVGAGVGGDPITSNVPLRFHVSPTKIRTSYVPGNQFSMEISESVYPNPPDPPFQGIV